MKTIFTDGAKSVNIPMDFDSDLGWTPPGKSAEGGQLYASVAAVFRAAHINADALAALPFALVDERGDDYDVSEDWQNKIKVMPNPRELLRLWRLSLFVANAAYGYIDRQKVGGRNVDKLRYIAPTTITIDADADGLRGFERQIGARKIYWQAADPRVVHMFRRDYDTELLPSDNTELNACLASAGIMYYSDNFIRDFFKRGGIKPTMLMVKGIPQPAAQERLETYWDRLMRGMTRVVGKVFNADMIEAKQIGAGADDLKDTALYRQAIENVAMASGIPLSLLLANSANFATAQAEYASWYRDSVTPWANFVADALNDTLFARMGLRMEFRPEQAAPGQEEEVQRAQAARQYYDILAAGGYSQPLKLAFQITGVDLPPDIDPETLDVKGEEAAPLPRAGAAPQPAPQPETPAARFAPNWAQFEEMKIWRDKAFRAAKNNAAPPVDFECIELPAEVAADIRAALVMAKGERDIRAAFDYDAAPRPVSDDEGIKALADALNALAAKYTAQPAPAPTPQPITVNLTAQMPEVGAPAVTVNVPELKQSPPTITVNVPDQPAPNVTVINEVQPAPVVNNVTVEPAPVTVAKPRKAKVQRDDAGRITGITTE